MSGLPVVVVGSGLTALGAQRALASAGIRPYLLADERDIATRSRWYRRPRGAPLPPDAPFADRVAALPFARAVLIPCADRHVLAIARLPEPLRQRFPASVASVEALETFVDKGRFAALLCTTGVPHPRTLALATPEEVGALPDEAFARSFLNPRDSQRFFARFKVKGYTVSGRTEALERLRALNAEGFSMMFQEYVPGPPTNHYFVEGFRDGHQSTRAVFVRQRLRMYPPDFGNSTSMISVAAEDVQPAVESVERLLTATRYRGVFSAEFKRDERDGEYRILELNTRPWWYVEFANRCGVNVCEMSYRDAQGLDVEQVTSYAVGRRCIFPYYDFFACSALWRAGRLSARAWLSSWAGAMQPVLTWRDPIPGLRASAAVFIGRLRRLLRWPPGERRRTQP